jgi:hypothetical protein
VREDVCVITPTHISSTMFPSSACRSPRIPGAWPGIDATGAGRSPRVSSRPYSALSQIGNDARSLPRPARRPPPQVSVIPLPPPLHDAQAVVLCLLNIFIAIVDIRQVGEAPIGAMGSAPTCGPCHGHALSGRRKSGGGRFHTGK